ncbi:MAG: SdrD B-like domain-containing protein [Caldilineales bacterium]
MSPPPGTSERADLESGSSNTDSAALGAADATQAAVGSTGNGVFNLSGSGSTPWRALTVVLRPATTEPVPPACRTKIDFEADAQGLPMTTGQIIDDEWTAWGITVTTNDPVNHPAMVFDSAAPTGGDPDLGTPNQDFGGPGIGFGGSAGQPGENSLALGKILIISEDGDSSDPDDNAGGGMIFFDYAADVTIDSLEILDIEETAAAYVRVYDAGNTLLKQVAIQTLGDNSYQTVVVDQSGVRRLEIDFAGSGGVPSVTQSLPLLGCLGDYVWHDDNRDQNEDYGVENPIAGVRVRLLRKVGASLTLFRITTTDANGFYLFDKLEAGDYIVDVNEFDLFTYFPGGFTITTFNEPYSYALAAGEEHREADFGYDNLDGEVALGDWVWYDVDGNGLQDDGGPDDVGIPCVTVELLDNSGAPIGLTNTDSWGIYHYYGLPPGSYSTRVYPQDPDIDAFILWKTAGSPDPTCSIDDLPTAAPRAPITTPPEKSTDLPDPGDYDWTLDYGFTDAPLAVSLASFDAQADAGAVRVNWETVSELNNAGFNLYRGSSTAPEILLANVPSATPGASYGAAYEWTDADVVAGDVYWYWLEDVDFNGATTLHGPVSAQAAAPTAVTLGVFDAASTASPGGGYLLAAIAALVLLLRGRRARSLAR